VTVQQERGERGAQGERVDRRDHGGDRNRHRKLFVKLTAQTADKSRGNKDRTEHQRGGDNRPGDLGHGLLRRLDRGQSVPDISLHIFHDDDRVIDHNPDCQNQAKKRQIVDAKP
jgi:hypothetical protein